MQSLKQTLQDAAQDARSELREQFIDDTGVDPFTGKAKRDWADDMMTTGQPGKFPNQLLGHCYQNAREMSGQLHDRGIQHHVLYVGLVELVSQFTDTDYEVFANASSLDDLPEDIPRTKRRMFDAANHYIIEVRGNETDFDTDDSFIVEPVSEIRFLDESVHGDIFVGEFPWADYIRLEDSEQEPWEHDPDWHWNTRTLEVYPESKYADNSPPLQG